MLRREILKGMMASGAMAAFGAAPVLARDKKVLRVTAFLPKDDVNLTAFRAFLDAVNARSAETGLELNWIGGPEAMPPFQQFGALTNGVVDMIFSVESYYGQDVTKGAYAHLTQITPAEERASGYHAFRQELLRPHGAHYLGRGEFGPWFHIFTNKPVTTLADFRGQRIRTSATYVAFVEALGAIPTNMPGTDVYMALDRNQIEGYAWSVLGNKAASWHEVVKYVVKPRIFNMNIEVLVNSSAWDRLTDAQRAVLDEEMARNEVEFTEVMTELAETEYADLLASGMTELSLSDEEAEAYVKLAYESQWRSFTATAGEELAQKLKSLLGA